MKANETTFVSRATRPSKTEVCGCVTIRKCIIQILNRQFKEFLASAINAEDHSSSKENSISTFGQFTMKPRVNMNVIDVTNHSKVSLPSNLICITSTIPKDL
jgi:hypothetical protein